MSVIHRPGRDVRVLMTESGASDDGSVTRFLIGTLYRVRLPAAIATGVPGATIEGFTIWSDNSGDISQILTARMDGVGQDHIHIGGSLRHSGTLVLTDTAAISLSVDYE